MIRLLLGIALAISMIGCGQPAPKTADPNVREVSSSDPRMDEAISNARANFGTFKEFLANPPKGSHLGVKVKLTGPDGGVEHIWLADVSLSEGRIKGVLDNDPVYLRQKAGDPIDVPESALSDWVVFDQDGKRVMGGYTIDALKK